MALRFLVPTPCTVEERFHTLVPDAECGQRGQVGSIYWQDIVETSLMKLSNITTIRRIVLEMDQFLEVI